MTRMRPVAIGVITSALLMGLSVPVFAQEEEPELGWSNTTEFSLVGTSGNSDTQTVGFKDLLRKKMKSSAFRLRVEGVRAESADDRFAVVDPATVVPSPPPLADQDVGLILVTPSRDVDVNNFLVEGRYDRNITENFFWHVGAGWDKNKDAGITSRSQVFAGVGNTWWDREDLTFATAYGVSYTDAEYDTFDPERDESFPGVRFEWNYFNKFGKVTEYRNDWSINGNLNDLGDFRYDMVNSIRVAMSEHLALQFSLQWLYANKPALEDIDVKLFTDEDGNVVWPCTTTCTESILGETQIRKKKLDSVFNVSLVVNF